MVLQALRVPDSLGFGLLEDLGCLVYLREAEGGGARAKEGGEAAGALRGKRPELLLQGRRLDERQVGERVQICLLYTSRCV